MDLVIQGEFIELQKETTAVLVEQRIVLSYHERVDVFLDKIIEIKAVHKKLIAQYHVAIEKIVGTLEADLNNYQLFFIAESIKSLIDVTKRLIKSFEAKLKIICASELQQYRVLCSDITEIYNDTQTRISGDKEMDDILAAI